MGGALSIEPAIELASREIEEKLKVAVGLASQEVDEKLKSINAVAAELMNLASGHGDEKLRLVNMVFDRQRGKLLSSAIAFMYFTLLMAYSLYSQSLGAGTRGENLFVVLQFVILGVWIADLVSFIGSGTIRDGFYIFALLMAFAGFVFCRGRNDKGRKFEGKKEVVGQ